MTNTPFDPSTAGTWEALARYVSGESSEQEAAALRAWLRADPRRNELLETMRQTIDRVATAPAADVDVERALRSVHARMGNDMSETRVIDFTMPKPVQTKRRALPLSPLLRAAAFGAILIAGALLWRKVDVAVEQNAQTQIYMTATGQTDTIQLADGSTVVLGPGSDLQIATDYGRDTRTVTLHGVALFEVQHDEAVPFVVHAGDAIVRDLGTVFTVWNHEGATVRVDVTEGSVMLQQGDRQGVVLSAGDRGEIRANAPVATRGVADDESTSWTRGELVFDDAELTHVAAELRNWYGIELRLPDALRTRHVTATFRATDSAQHVIGVLSAVLGAQVRMQGDTAVLSTGS